jgi:hypothetical protein
VFAGLRGYDYRLARVTSVLFGAAGVLSILGAIGFVARNEWLELGVLFSGIVFLAALVGTAVLLYQFQAGDVPESE